MPSIKCLDRMVDQNKLESAEFTLKMLLERSDLA